MAAAFRDVEAATLALDGSPPITRITFPTCRAHYPGGSNGCACRLLPRSCCLPLLTGGSASALGLSRPAQASLTLRPTGLLNRLKRPLSRGSSPAGYPTEPLVSYQINRQLSGWNLPPLVIRAFGAHGQKRRFDRRPVTIAVGTRVTSRPPHRSVRAQFGHTACMGLSLSRGRHAILVVLCIPFFCSTRAASILPSRPHIAIAVARSGGQGRRFFSAAEGLSLTDASTAAGCRRSGGWSRDDPRGACHWPRSIARTTLVFG